MTYSYICTSCSHEWEAQQRISEAPLQVCPQCNQSSAKRQIAGPANFILKGGGWYSDLYSSSSGKKAEGEKTTKAPEKVEKVEKSESAAPAEKKAESPSSSTPSTPSSSSSTSS